MSYVIRYDGTSPITGDQWHGFETFTVWSGDDRLALVKFAISNTAAAVLGPALPEHQIEGGQLKDVIVDALRRFGSATMRQLISRPEDLAQLLAEDERTVLVSSSNLQPILQRVATKACDYQSREGGALYCAAASKTDEAVVAQVGLRFFAPTSVAACIGCGVPDEEYRCRHLGFVSVISAGYGHHYQRLAGQGLCEIGSSAMEGGVDGCHAAGYECWEQAPLDERSADVTTITSLSLAESLDVVNALWRLAFGKRHRLLMLRSAAEVTGLALSAQTRDDFQARVDDLSDVLTHLEVDDDLVSPEAPEQFKKGSLNRLQTALAQRVGDERARELIAPLRAIVSIRTSLTHSDRASELVTHSASRGLYWPPNDWDAAWQRVRIAAIQALKSLRDTLQDVVDEAADEAPKQS
jgi:hypothetical protein